MSLLAETAPIAAEPWLWFAGSLLAYAAFISLNPLGGCFLRAYRLIRTRLYLWLLPGAFGLTSVTFALATGRITDTGAALGTPSDLVGRSLAEAWEILPTFPHIAVVAYPLSVIAALLYLTNAGRVLVTLGKSQAWTGRTAWVSGFGLTIISALAHLAVGGADLIRLDWTPHASLAVLSHCFTLFVGMFAQAYLIAGIILAAAPAKKNLLHPSAFSPSAALSRATECFPRIIPLVALYIIVWAVDIYGGKAASTAFAARYIVPEILLVLAFLPPSALVVKGGFAAVGGVALGALFRSWWVWIWGLVGIFLTTFLARFAASGLNSAWSAYSSEGTAWRLIYPVLWGAVATWMLAAWVIAFREFVLPAAGAKSKRASKESRKPKSSRR